MFSRRTLRESDSEFDGINLPEFESFNPAYTSFEEIPRNSNRTSSRPLISRKPVPSSSPIYPSAESMKSNASPERPRMIEQHPFRNSILGLLLGGLTIPFFLYGSYAWHMHGQIVKSQSEWTKLNEFGKRLATAFPFAFSLVLSRAIKQVAAWKLERGTTLGSLEQTMGSLTLGSTVVTQFTIRRFNIAALLLLCAWGLSPIGSQSSLQILNVGLQIVESTTGVYYFNTDSDPGFSEGDIWNGPSLNAMFSASLMSPASIRNSTMDLWGNVKVPDISRLPVFRPNTTKWFNLENTADLTFSSVLGIPLSNISEQGNSTFTMETSYLSVDCYDNITTFDTFFNYTSLNSETGDYTSNNTYYAANWSYVVPHGEFDFQIAVNGFYKGGTYGNVLEYINDTSTYEPRTLRFQSKYGNISAWCPITTIYVESAVKCVGTSCAVTAIRPSQLHHPNSNLTNLGFKEAFGEFSTTLIKSSTLQLHDGASTALENFISNPDLAPEVGNIYEISMQNISLNDFGSRLQQVINTYWYGSYDPTSMMGFLNTNNSAESPYVPHIAILTQAKNVVWQEVYVCYYGWLLALFAATSMMLAAAVIGALFSFKSRGPDLLGYCSTFVRDTPSVRDGNWGSAMDGSERARLFGKMRLRIMDFEPEKEVGFIAIVEDTFGDPRSELIKERHYR